MPRAILVFRLPQERSEFELAQQAGPLASSLADVSRYVRDKLKYGEITKEEEATFKELWELIDREALDRAGF